VQAYNIITLKLYIARECYCYRCMQCGAKDVAKMWNKYLEKAMQLDF